MNEMQRYFQQKAADPMNLHNLNLARLARNERDINDRVTQEIQKVSDMAASTTAVHISVDKVDAMEGRIKSLDDWAGDITGRTDANA